MGTRSTSWRALGTSAVLKVTEPAALDGARLVVEAELARVDRACSRFREDSDLSRVNAATGRMVAVDPLLVEAIEVGLRAARLTDGDVDPALGEALELAGYDRDWVLLDPPVAEAAGRREPAAAPTPALSARRTPGWLSIELDRERSRVRLPRDVKLDLGATAKAWAADRSACAAERETGCGVLVSLGGDVATAGSSPPDGWRVRVTDDHRAALEAPGQTIAIRDGGLATSSTTVRRWSHQGVEMHHLIDPATGQPAAGPWRTVSVAAATCTDANIASTAALVRGRGAPAWLAAHGLPALLIDHRGHARRVGGWPDCGEAAAVARTREAGVA